MRTVTPLDLRQRLGQILDAASAGERFVIERNHRPLAMLVSIDDGRRLDEGAEERRRRRIAALDRLAELGRESAERYRSRLTSTELLRLDRDRDEPGDEDADDA
ncbi:MAG TPA: type II toxin-antitoxin system prevent-host-death family antitoxin [Candidatus Limnocylindrales bacterium]|nr:type II toxin-antitoxin system prevent-host-death family antitoxin [Candidatus Limnocylindrales bacterium]